MLPFAQCVLIDLFRHSQYYHILNPIDAALVSEMASIVASKTVYTRIFFLLILEYPPMEGKEKRWGWQGEAVEY